MRINIYGINLDFTRIGEVDFVWVRLVFAEFTEVVDFVFIIAFKASTYK